jgi:hypothetical protein
MRGGLPGMPGVQQVPRGTGGVAIVGGGIVGDDVNPSAAVLQPKKKNKHGVFFWVGGGASLAAIAVLMVFLLRTPSSAAGDMEAHSPNSIFLEGFYDNNNNPTGWVPPGSVPVKDPGKTTADPATKRPRPPTVKPPVVASNNPGRVSDVEDLSNSGGQSITDRDAQEVLDAQQRFGAGLKWCYERALKINPDLKGANNRYDVSITITAVGGVRGVSVAGKDKTLKDCLEAKVKTWNFKPARGDFPTQFPIVFN